METLIVVEVLEKSGKVHERLKLSQLPITLGRAYDAEVILNDDFVSPYHARIARGAEGELILSDLDSENGSYLMPALRAFNTQVLGADTLIRLGQTVVRLRRPDFRLAPTLRDTLLSSRIARRISSGATLALLSMLALALLAFSLYQDTPQQIKTGKWLLEILEIAIVIPVWAGFWAVLSRVFAHHTAFVAHAVIACLGLLGFLLLDTAIEYYAFAFSALLSADVLTHSVFGIMGCAMLYGHLRFATLLAPRLAASVAAISASGLVALSAFALYVQNLDFDDTLRYPSELKPAAFRLSRETTPQQFIQDARRLEKRLRD